MDHAETKKAHNDHNVYILEENVSLLGAPGSASRDSRRVLRLL
jgi:hypothetical protein